MSLPSHSSMPPRLSQEHLNRLIETVRDWQFEHGSLLKVPPNSGNVLARPIAVTLFPSNFPKSCFEQARNLQTIFNRLYAAISEDEQWLFGVLQRLIQSDSMAQILWKIYSAVKAKGCIQDLTLGIFRSDYMLQAVPGNSEICIKQVEFNTYSVAGGGHSNKISNMHKYLAETGAYANEGVKIGPSIPVNSTIQSIATALATAHEAYGTTISNSGFVTAVLFVVQPNNVNICDERPIEYALRERGVPVYRVEFRGFLDKTSLSPSRELLYNSETSDSVVTIEISVVYLRAGYEMKEYTDSGCEARYRMEISRAIKCPSLLCHLATLKVVQQKLAEPDCLERFISREESLQIQDTFAPLYPLDESNLGRRARELACNPETAVHYVLKPSLEGGGHNIYRADIPEFLQSVPESSWAEYILMAIIEPPDVQNVLLSPREIYSGPVISELGIFGTCLWRRGSSGLKFLENQEAGFSFKTKRPDIDEMSVVKGYGCFDSPFLI